MSESHKLSGNRRHAIGGFLVVASICFALFIDVGKALAQATATPSTSPTTSSGEEKKTLEESDKTLELPAFEVTAAKERGYYSPNSTAATRLDTPLNETPQSIYILNEELLRDIAATDLNEILRYAPEVGVGEGLDEVRPGIRGFELSDPLADGFSEPAKSPMSTANLDRVEVLAGPSSIFFANNSGIGGGINRATKRPDFGRSFGSIEVNAKSEDYYRAVFDHTGPIKAGGPWAYRLVTEAYTANQNNGYVQDFVSKERLAVMPSLGWRPSERTTLYLNGEILFENNNREYTMDYVVAGQIVPVPIAVNPRGEFVDEHLKKFSLRALLYHNLSANWALRVGASALVFYREGGFINFGGNGAMNADQRSISRTGRLYTWGTNEEYAVQIDLAGKFSTGPLAHQAVAGMDFDHSINDNFSRLGAFTPTRFDLFTPDYTQQPATLAANRDQVLRINRPNIYLNDQIRLWGNRLILNGGLRASTYSQGNSAATYLGGVRTPTPKVSFDGDWVYQPRAGVVYRPWPSTSLYYSYAETFQARTNTNPDGSTFPPSTGIQHEVGAKLSLRDGRIVLNVSAYDLVSANQLEPDPLQAGYSIASRTLATTGWNANAILNLTDALQFTAAYSDSNGEIEESNDPALAGTERAGIAGARYQWSVRYSWRTGRLRGVVVGVFGRYVGDRIASANFPSFRVPASDSYDVFASYRRKNWRAQVNVKNIENDERNYQWGGVNAQGNGRVRRDPPLEFTLSLTREI